MIKAIIFDKDGTLLELGALWNQPTIAAVKDLMEYSHLSTSKQTLYLKEIGIDGDKLKSNSLFTAGSVKEQAEELSRVVTLSTEKIYHFLETFYLESLKQLDMHQFVIPHAKEVLIHLKKQNYFLGLITNDQRLLTEWMLKACDLYDMFDFIGCADDYVPKPHPMALEAMAKELNLSLDEMVYVGDSSVDMEYAKHVNAGIGVSFTPENELHVKEATYIVRSLDEIPNLIKSMY